MISSELYTRTTGAGPPVLLLHGFGATSFTWRFLTPALTSSFEVTEVDLLGCGQSPKPEGGDYSVRGHSMLIERLLAERGLRAVTLVGHSFGGSVALLTALKLHGAGIVRRLVLIDAPTYRQRVPLFIQALRSPLGPAITRTIPPEVQVRAVLQLAYFEDAAVSKESVRAYASALRTQGGRHALVRTARELIPPDIDEIATRYSSLTTPTLILWGDHDEIVPLSTGQRLARDLPHASLSVIARAGHLPHEERPDEAIPIVSRFLANH